jgi:hypothetical protein
MAKIFVIPSKTARVRFPLSASRILPKEGAWVQDDPFWQRRIQDGDVTLIPDKKEDELTMQEQKKEQEPIQPQKKKKG